MRFGRLLASVLALAAPLGQAADIAVVPAAVSLSSHNDRTLVQIVNQGPEAVVLQAEAITGQRDGGAAKDGRTHDLIVEPAVFTLAPGRTQSVRIGLRRHVDADREMTYQLVLRDAPVSPRINGPARMALQVPVYVAPTAVRREQRWNARIDEEGHLIAQVANTGNVHYKVGSLRVSGDTRSAGTLAQGALSVLLPGEVRSFRLRAPALPISKTLSIEVRTEFGMQRVALDLSPH